VDGKNHGAQYLPATPNDYKGKKERRMLTKRSVPPMLRRTPESIAKFLSDEQLKLYRLIWQRSLPRR